jgi:exopolyphosphatase/guanosine-5'-triphosphate,3'-diphosphate pyrophosphatase
MTPVAALDCGTNSTRLLVLADDGTTLDRRMHITRLGEGVDASGELRADAITRTIDVLREYRMAMDRLGVTSGRLAATSAARDARNGSEFLDAASKATGITAELLSGEEEGRLSFAGATADLEGPLEHVVVVDIGGGSTELVVSDHGDVRAHSMQVGCVRVTERTLWDDPPTPTELAAARSMVDRAIDGAVAAMPELASDSDRTIVGLAGTVSTLAGVDLGLAEYDEVRLHHHWLSLESIRAWGAELAAEGVDARRARPGMVPGREDVIVAGVLVLERVVERLGAKGCLSSEHDILDGLAHSVLSGRRG